jgi:hypothetical protein
MSPWSVAIEALLKKASRSKRRAARQIVPYSAFSQWRRSSRGAAIVTLDRLLAGRADVGAGRGVRRGETRDPAPGHSQYRTASEA